MKQIFASLLLITVMAPEANAACAIPNEVCKLSEKCIYDSAPGRANDRDRIMQGIRTNTGNLIWQGLEACTKDMSLKDSFARSTPSCSDTDFVSAATAGLAQQCDHSRSLICASNEQGRLVVRGNMDGNLCTGAKTKGAMCQCGGFFGQVY